MRVILSICAAALLTALRSTGADGPAEVSGVFGKAFIQTFAGETPLRAGARIDAGSRIRTETGGAADIFLGKEAGVIRLTQNTFVHIEQLQATNDASLIYVHLQQGSILGNGSNVRDTSRFQIKTATGIAGISRAAFRVHAEGYFIVLDGKAHFAHVPTNAEPKLHSLDAPPPVYFSPQHGVQPAPKELVREIVNQSRARLGSER